MTFTHPGSRGENGRKYDNEQEEEEKISWQNAGRKAGPGREGADNAVQDVFM